MKNLDRQRRSVTEQTLRQLRETPSDSAWLAIEDRVAEIESRLATANLNVDPALARGIN